MSISLANLFAHCIYHQNGAVVSYQLLQRQGWQLGVMAMFLAYFTIFVAISGWCMTLIQEVIRREFIRDLFVDIEL